MPTLSQLRKSKADKAVELKAAIDDVEKFESLAKEIEGIDADIAAGEAEELAAADRRARVAKIDKDLQALQPRKASPNPIVNLGVDLPGPLVVVDDRPFKTLGQQLQAIAGVSLSGATDNRLVWQTLAPATGSAQAGVPSDGGYLIQKDFSTALLDRVNELSTLKSMVTKITIGPESDGVRLPVVDETSRATGSRWGGVQMYWGAENDAATAKKPKFRQMELELKDLIGLAYVSNRLLRDATAVESVFMKAFSEETAFMIDDAIWEGSGAGVPLGIMNCPAVVSVAKETGQGAATLLAENILKMYSRMWARSRPNAVWFINQDIEPQLFGLTMPNTNPGVPIYMPAGGLSAAPYASLMGRPVVPLEYCATLGTTGDIVFADLSQVVAIEKDAMQADSSLHVRFTTNENTFRFISRFDAQPTWNSAVTPFKGSATKSPFIKLDTRS